MRLHKDLPAPGTAKALDASRTHSFAELQRVTAFRAVIGLVYTHMIAGLRLKLPLEVESKLFAHQVRSGCPTANGTILGGIPAT